VFSWRQSEGEMNWRIAPVDSQELLFLPTFRGCLVNNLFISCCYLGHIHGSTGEVNCSFRGNLGITQYSYWDMGWRHRNRGLISGMKRGFSTHHSIQTDFGALTAFCTMGSGVFFPGNKAAGAWSWHLSSMSCRKQAGVELYPARSYTYSGTTLHFTLIHLQYNNCCHQRSFASSGKSSICTCWDVLDFLSVVEIVFRDFSHSHVQNRVSEL
jgi:hypothetical protein